MDALRRLEGVEIAQRIAESGISIYDPLDPKSPLFVEVDVLEHRLRHQLLGLHLGYPLRTRAKVSKTAVCQAIGYPTPSTFRKTQPRFPGQNLDVYVQKADNLQIWNEEVVPSRRYAIIRIDGADRVVDVRVVTGETIARLDRTGTLTKKYQARRPIGQIESALISNRDTSNFILLLQPSSGLPSQQLARLSPTTRPVPGSVLAIAAVYNRLLDLIGTEVPDPGLDQERLRGEALHRRVCQALGLGQYGDRGQFPDVLCQALEVKLQTSPTIDLGLVAPDSTEIAQEVSSAIRHCDVRYAVFYGVRTNSKSIRLSGLVVSTGASFFTRFQRFEGRVVNRKLQIKLPAGFFSETK